MDFAPAAPNPALAVPPLEGSAPRSVFLAAALGWLFPGLGQVYVGRPGKALVMLVAVGGLFWAGLVLTGYTCVNPNTYSLEFAAHAFLGGPTAGAFYLTKDIRLEQLMPWFEVGRLYAAVAGLLNIVAICDAMGEVLDRNKRARARNELRRAWFERQQREFEERAAAIEAQLDEQLPAREPEAGETEPREEAGDEPPRPSDPWGTS